ncbi:MAG: RNA 2'-phosphotransferase [Planctomycetota bacterium]
MDPKKETKISKSLSYHLRHNPDELGIQLDSAGWVDVEVLLKAYQERKFPISLDELSYVVENNNKQRYAFSSDRKKIRASQGHTVDVELDYHEATPPETLYHGTAAHNREILLKTGLKKMQRHHVHMSPERDTAINVGKRHGKPLIFLVASLKMHQAGYVFFCSANGVWLTDYVPPEFLTLDSNS